MEPPPAPLTRPEPVLALYRRHPAVHPYGIADVVQLWDRSRWWLDGAAAVGALDLPGSPVPVLYAVAADDGATTLDLLARLEPSLPERFVITGPRGLTARLAAHYEPVWSWDYRKMHLAHPAALPPPDPAVRRLGRADLPALERLFATDEHAGDFFHAGLLDTGFYVGRPIGAELAATAGIHVIDRTHGVAAIGNVATAPAFRRRGLARSVVATLCHRLLAEIAVIGLNVRESNLGARRLYERLGFEPLVPYEEAELRRRRPPPLVR